MTDQIKVGDVVQLKSGGPKMTVASIDEKGRAWCSWFVNGENHREVFRPESLEQVDQK